MVRVDQVNHALRVSKGACALVRNVVFCAGVGVVVVDDLHRPARLHDEMRRLSWLRFGMSWQCNRERRKRHQRGMQDISKRFHLYLDAGRFFWRFAMPGIAPRSSSVVPILPLSSSPSSFFVGLSTSWPAR